MYLKKIYLYGIISTIIGSCRFIPIVNKTIFIDYAQYYSFYHIERSIVFS